MDKAAKTSLNIVKEVLAEFPGVVLESITNGRGSHKKLRVRYGEKHAMLIIARYNEGDQRNLKNLRAQTRSKLINLTTKETIK